MTVQILVSTMHQQDYSLIEKMNIFSDTIVINQCDETSYKQLNYKGFRIDWYNTQTRGVGISRNMALLHSSADVCLFADDDMVYGDDTRKSIITAFDKNKNVDMIIFEIGGLSKKKIKEKNVSFFNAIGFGACRIAVRRDSLLKKRIMFSVLFGGGAKYSCGEDTIFICDFLKNGLKCRSCTNQIGVNMHGESTWFKGYNEKFIYDKGVLLRQLFGVVGIFPLVALLIKHPEWHMELGWRKALVCAISGWRSL